jgi:hypothetical protein
VYSSPEGEYFIFEDLSRPGDAEGRSLRQLKQNQLIVTLEQFDQMTEETPTSRQRAIGRLL